MVDVKTDETLQHVQNLLAAGNAQKAANILVAAAMNGHVDALYALALWAVSGDIIPRNLPLAYDLLYRAKIAGHIDAALLHASFTATGTGCSRNWHVALNDIRSLTEKSIFAQKQSQLLDLMNLDESGNPLERRDVSLVSGAPKIAIYPELLTCAECDYITDSGAPYLMPSQVFNPQTGQLMPHPVRRSLGTMFGVHSEDLVISAINHRIAAVSGTSYAQGEPLQLLQYQSGDEYRPHLDALPNEQNQRVMTAIVYLSDDYEGGETKFLRTGYSFKGRKGDALLFSNTLPNGQADPLALHCGLPVVSGTKSIATRWIRRFPFTYPDPPSVLDKVPRFAN